MAAAVQDADNRCERAPRDAPPFAPPHRATRAAAARRAAGPRPGRGFALRVVAPAVPRPLAAWCVAPAGVLRAT